MINVNFNELKQKNPDTKGWIQVNGTNINYPFVQTNNNKFYLNHTFNKTYNSAGWVFLDYRNNINELSKNTIIYAHGRLDTTMFGSLKNILSSGWLNNTNNYVVKLSTETENTLWQVFSVYHIPTTSDYIQVNFVSNDEFNKWSKLLLERSQHNFNTTINENDKVLTLSTCYNDKEKIVLHAKLIKKETRY
jgi:sortase B